MGEGGTIDEIEAAALRGLLGLTDAKIAYTARRQDAVWTFGPQIGLNGDVAGVAVREELVPYAEALRTGLTICYEDPAAMGTEMAALLGAIGLGSLYAVPIMKAGECVGALAVGAPGPSLFGPRDRALVRLFTAHLSALIAKRDLVQSLETLAESVPVIVLRTEPSGWINWYNRRWYEFTGQTREEAAGWGWQTAHHPVDFQRVMKEWPLALATGQPIEIEFRLKRYDGVYHWHLARVEPVRDDNGTILSWYGSVIDIEAQKAALERARRSVWIRPTFPPKAMRAWAATGTTHLRCPTAGSRSRSATWPDTASRRRWPWANCAKRSTWSRNATTTRPESWRKRTASYACKNPARSSRLSSASSMPPAPKCATRPPAIPRR
jgi:PAS domain S-box-containing protein